MSAITQVQIQNVVDQVLRDMTQRFGGICLCKKDTVLSGDICTVYTIFEGSYCGALVLCADTALFNRLARYAMPEEDVDQDIFRDLVIEYFNVVCGHIVAGLNRICYGPARFRVPIFSAGRYIPIEDDGVMGVINYANDQNEGAQLISQLMSA